MRVSWHGGRRLCCNGVRFERDWKAVSSLGGGLLHTDTVFCS